VTTRAGALQNRAKEDMKAARHVLAQAGVTTSQSVIASEERIDGRQHWVVQNQSRLEIWANSPPLEGRWAVELRLVYDADPAAGAVFVRKGSLGLGRETDPDQGSHSFLRYDVDVANVIVLDEPCHLNVLQEAPFDDRIHFRLPGVPITEWSLEPTLKYLCSRELRDELRARFT
jgi:hypothetical protein